VASFVASPTLYSAKRTVDVGVDPLPQVPLDARHSQMAECPARLSGSCTSDDHRSESCALWFLMHCTSDAIRSLVPRTWPHRVPSAPLADQYTYLFREALAAPTPSSRLREALREFKWLNADGPQTLDPELVAAPSTEYTLSVACCAPQCPGSGAQPAAHLEGTEPAQQEQQLYQARPASLASHPLRSRRRGRPRHFVADA
jgi:hypothetical protein